MNQLEVDHGCYKNISLLSLATVSHKYTSHSFRGRKPDIIIWLHQVLEPFLLKTSASKETCLPQKIFEFICSRIFITHSWILPRNASCCTKHLSWKERNFCSCLVMLTRWCWFNRCLTSLYHPFSWMGKAKYDSKNEFYQVYLYACCPLPHSCTE